MSESNGKAKASLYDLDISEISMTDESQGFAASGMETILYKNRETRKEDLTKEQLALLEKYGEEFTPLQKQLSDTNSLSSVKSDAGEDNLTKGNEMSEDKIALQKALDEIAVLKQEKQDVETKQLESDIEKYQFSESEAVVKALQGVEVLEREVLIKAFGDIFAAKEVITKSLELKTDVDAQHAEVGADGEAEIEKAVDPKDLNAQLKELNKENK